MHNPPFWLLKECATQLWFLFKQLQELHHHCDLTSVCIPQRILSLTFMVPKSDYFILESETYRH